ncbi:MAG: hypothetical protein JO265_05280 [Acidimicrobiia bacterium]|nr:hypothetical protein [Acidimicrobiia bacterium]
MLCRPALGADPASFASRIADEAASLRELQRDGVLIEAWSPGSPGAVLILEAQDTDAATAITSRLPLVAAGLVTTEVIPLHHLEF